MIRDKNKIYGEVNLENTIITRDEANLNQGMYLRSDSNNTVVTIGLASWNILYTNSSGNAFVLSLGPNQAVGTDNNGNIRAIDRSTIL